jgi:hypothetical protein
MDGWIKLHRKFLSWEWFDISDMIKLFIFLSLSANHTDGTWRGIEIKRGQYLTGLNSLSEKTKISIQTLRTCLKRLEKTGEINMQVTNKYRMITICNYDSYQESQQPHSKQPNKQPTSSQQAANSKQECKKDNNEKEEKKIEFNIFWNLYNKKMARAKCEPLWNKLNDSDREKIIETLPLFLSNIKDKQFQPFPQTYLNQKRWEDELPNSKPKPIIDDGKERKEYMYYGDPVWHAHTIEESKEYMRKYATNIRNQRDVNKRV